MNPRTKGILVFAALLVIAVLYVVLSPIIAPRLAPVFKSACKPIVVTGVVGSEKSSLLQNPEVIQILQNKYCITVKFNTMGSIEQVTAPPANQDFLWPSNAIAVEIWKANGGAGKSATIFRSPIVIYSWGPVVDALIQKGIAEKVGDTYFVDMPRLSDLMAQNTKWSEVGLPQIYGKIQVISSDPTKSNSGNMFYLLMGAMLNGGTVVDTSTVESVVPKLYAYYQGLGYLEDGSAKAFQAYIGEGMGAKPLMAGYENQATEFILENPKHRDLILQNVIVLYPRPTVWADHPFIALNSNGEALLTAMQDPQIQQLAWKRHGFRTGLAGVENDPKDVGLPGLPATIEYVMPLPKSDVALRIISYLQNGR